MFKLKEGGGELLTNRRQFFFFFFSSSLLQMGTFPEKERKKRDERGVFKLKEKGESCSLIEDSFSFFFFIF